MELTDDEREPIEEIAEEFLERRRRGESVTIAEFAREHPELATDIVDLFPAMLLLEQGRPSETEGPDPPDQPVHVPEVLGDYRILKRIGGGGMGVVFEAEQISLQRRVALKVLRPELEENSQRRRRFRVETQAAGRLHHTNIVPVFGVGQDAGWHYYVMQFVAGTGLDEVLTALRARHPSLAAGLNENSILPAARRLAHSLRTGVWPGLHPSFPEAPIGHPSDSDQNSECDVGSIPRVYWRSIGRLGRQLASALHYAHDQGIVHRDIKPSNLLLDENGIIWITDFGLAQLDDHQDLTKTGELLGTLRYLAPEALTNTFDARSDIYSLGLTLYEMASFRPAFSAANPSQLLTQLTVASVPRLERLKPDIPRDLATIIHKAIDADPRCRYQTAAEMEEDFGRFLSDRPILARRASPMERLASWSRRNRGLAGSLAAILVLLLVFAVCGLGAASIYYRIATENGRLAATRTELIRKIDAEHSSTRLALADMYSSYGVQEAERGHDPEALLWFVQAAGESVTDPSRLLANHFRMDAWYRHSSRPTSVLPNSQHIDTLVFHPEQPYLLGQPRHPQTPPILWDLNREQPLGFPQEFGSVSALGWSSKGDVLAVGNTQGRVLVCRFPELTVEQSFECTRPVRRLVFHSNDVALAISTGEEVRVWNSAERQMMIGPLAHPALVVDLFFSPDGLYLLTTAKDSLLRVFQVAPATATPTWIGPCDWDGGGWTKCRPQFDAAGTTMIVPQPGSELAWIKLLDGTTLRKTAVRRAGVVAPLFQLRTNRDRTLLAVACGDNGIQFFSTESGEHVGHLPSRSDLVIQFSPDGRSLVSAGSNRKAVIWSINDFAAQGIAAIHPTGFLSIALSPDGRQLATSGYDGLVSVWQLPEDRVQDITVEQPGAQVRGWFSHDSQQLFLREEDGTFRTARVGNDARLSWETIQAPGLLIEAVTDPDDRLVAMLWQTSSGQTQVGVWDLQTRQPRFSGVPLATPVPTHRRPGGGWYYADLIQFTPDESGVVVLTDRQVTFVDARSGKPRWKLDVPEHTTHMRLDHGGETMVLFGGPQIDVHELTRGDKRYSIPTSCLQLAVSPDNQLLAVGNDSNQLQFWNLATGAALPGSLDHPSWVEDLAFSHNGNLIVTYCKDGGVRVWDVVTRSRRGAPVFPGDACVFALTSDQRWLITLTTEEKLDVWDWQHAKQVAPARQFFNRHMNQVFTKSRNLALSPDHRWAFTGGRADQVHLLEMRSFHAAFPVDLLDRRLWSELIACSRLDDQDVLTPLTHPEWLQRWEHLRQLNRTHVPPFAAP